MESKGSGLVFIPVAICIIFVVLLAIPFVNQLVHVDQVLVCTSDPGHQPDIHLSPSSSISHVTSVTIQNTQLFDIWDVKPQGGSTFMLVSDPGTGQAYRNATAIALPITLRLICG